MKLILLLLSIGFGLHAAPPPQNTQMAKTTYISMDGDDAKGKRGNKGKKFRTFHGASLTALPFDTFEFDAGVYEATNIDLTFNWNFRGIGNVLLRSSYGDLFTDNSWANAPHTNHIEGDQMRLEAYGNVVYTSGWSPDYLMTFNVQSIYSPWQAMMLVGGTNVITVNREIGSGGWAIYNWDSNVTLNAPIAYTTTIDGTEDVYIQGGTRPSAAKGELNIGKGWASGTDFMGVFAGSCKLTAKELDMANGIFSTDRASEVIIDCPRITVGPSARWSDNSIIMCAATNYIIRGATITQTNTTAPRYAIEHAGGTLLLQDGSVTAANRQQIKNTSGTVKAVNFQYDPAQTSGTISP